MEPNEGRAHVRPRPAEALRRGLRGRCPECGKGALFRKGIQAHARCSECHLLYQRNYGDAGMFMMMTDRIPVLFGIVLLYFGFQTTNWFATTGFFLALILPIIATIRQRQGLALALDYLSRVYLPDPSDEIHGSREYFAE